MVYISRLLFCLIFWFAIPILPWPVLFGALIFAVAFWEWFFEAALLGLIFDALSGLPFGSYLLLFAALVILTEGIKSYLRSDGRFETISIAAIATVLFGVLEFIFFGVLFGRNAVLSAVFYRDLLTDWLAIALTVALFLAARILFRHIYPVKSARNLIG